MHLRTFMKKNNSQKGFTLIELLVVIAIVGILSAVVLASLGSAKSKGDDASIQATLKSVTNQAAIYHSQYGNYGVVASTCSTGIFNDGTTVGLLKLITAAQAKSASVACFSTTTPSAAFVVSAQLKTNTSKYWCVDSVGSSRMRTAAATSTAQLCAGN